MDVVVFGVGLLVAGGLLVLVSRGVMRRMRGPESVPAVAPSRPSAPPPSPPRPLARAVLGETEREAGALVDGLIIGHHLTRTHYQDRLEDQAETIDALHADAAAWTPGDDADPDDGAEDDGSDGDDGHDGHGSGGGSDHGARDPDLDAELDGFDAGGDPWEDDVFGFGGDDDD